jgi:Flp pilus assembly protein, protease CpaA
MAPRERVFSFWDAFPDTRTLHSVLFHMLGAGDIKLLSAVGGFLGVPAILKCMIVSFLSGAVLSIGIILVCGNLPQRLTKFFNYFQTYFTKRKYQKKTEPVPYYDGKWGMECIHFSVPVLMGVLLWIGGFY